MTHVTKLVMTKHTTFRELANHQSILHRGCLSRGVCFKQSDRVTRHGSHGFGKSWSWFALAARAALRWASNPFTKSSWCHLMIFCKPCAVLAYDPLFVTVLGHVGASAINKSSCNYGLSVQSQQTRKTPHTENLTCLRENRPQRSCY